MVVLLAGLLVRATGRFEACLSMASVLWMGDVVAIVTVGVCDEDCGEVVRQ